VRNTVGLIPWVKGQSGNLAGRPKHPVSRKELAPYKERIAKALVEAAEDPSRQEWALPIATVYLWGKPVEFQQTEEVEEMEAALATVNAMSLEDVENLVKQ